MREKLEKYAVVAVAITVLVLGIALILQIASTPPTSTQVAQVISLDAPDVLVGPAEEQRLKKKSLYVQIIDGCDSAYVGTCAESHSGPGKSYRVVSRLRNGMILKVADMVTGDDGLVWYKITFDEWLRYPERVEKNWWISSEHVHVFTNVGAEELDTQSTATTTKYILVDRSKQKLYAYENDAVFMEETISTGLEFTPTPRGTFTIYRKNPTRYMQGPLPGISDQYYDLPGVPWNLYFTKQGGVIHGTYWHNSFGQRWSHGCVNVPTDAAEKLYNWADIGTPVIVQD